MLWGDNWGYGNSDLVTIVIKPIGNTLSLADAISTESRITVTITNTFSVAGDMLFEGLFDPNGYAVVFGNSTNAENRPIASYTSEGVSVLSYTSEVNTVTTWTVV